MGKQLYVISLSEFDRAYLLRVLESSDSAWEVKRRAKVLLLADEGLKNREIQALTDLSEQGVIDIKKRYCRFGLCLSKRPSPGVKPKLDLEQQALLLKISLDPPPEGKKKWTKPDLARALVRDGIVDSISPETVRKYLKQLRELLNIEG